MRILIFWHPYQPYWSFQCQARADISLLEVDSKSSSVQTMNFTPSLTFLTPSLFCPAATFWRMFHTAKFKFSNSNLKILAQIVRKWLHFGQNGPKMRCEKILTQNMAWNAQNWPKKGSIFWPVLGVEGVICQPLCSGPNLALALGPSWPKTAKKVWQPCFSWLQAA